MGAFGWLVGWFPGDVGGRGEACLAYLAVLCHLQARDCDATAVGRLAWGVPDGVGSLLLSGALERLDGVQRAAHVGALCDEQRAVLDERLGLLLVELVLRRTGQGDIHLANVDPLRRMELAATSSSSFLFPSLFLHHPGRDGGLQSHIFQGGGGGRLLLTGRAPSMYLKEPLPLNEVRGPRASLMSAISLICSGVK